MNKSKLDRIVYDNIREEIINQTADLDKNQVVELLVQMAWKADYSKQVSAITRNAQFKSGSEVVQLSLFDKDSLEPVSDEVQEQIDNFNKKHLKELKDAKELILDRIGKLEKIIEKRESAAAQTSKKKSVKNRQPDSVEYRAVSEEVCPVCGAALEKIGTKSRYKIKMKPIEIILEEEVLETKKCPNECVDQDGALVLYTAEPAEPSLFSGSNATESLVAGLAYNKLIQGTPLYRMEKDFQRQGVELSRQTMSNVLMMGAEQYLMPVYEKILSDFRGLNIVHVDETTLKCLQLREERKTSYMIAGVSGEHEEKQMAVYQFSASRAQTFVTQLLGSEFSGVLMTDGLQAYENYPGTTHLNCMTHARRKIYEALTCRDDYKRFSRLKDYDQRVEYLEKNPSLNILISALRGFDDLYRIEANARYYSPEIIQEMRQEISTGVFSELSKTMTDIRNGFVESSVASKAAAYFLAREESLKKYMENGEYPIDNNRAERMIKPFVIARKNFLFANTERGAQMAGCYMTLLQSAVLNGLNPFEYLVYVLHTLKMKGISEKVINEILPYSAELPERLKDTV